MDRFGKREFALAALLAATIPAVNAEGPLLQDRRTDVLEQALTAAFDDRDLEEAGRICRELIDLKGRSMAPQELAGFLEDLAERFYSQELPEGVATAEELFQRALGLLEKAHGPSDPAVLEVMVALANLYFEEGRFEEALVLDRRALAIRARTPGTPQVEVASGERNVGVSLTRLGRFQEGQEHLERALHVAEHLNTGDSGETAYAIKELAENLRLQNRYAEAQPLMERAVALAEQELGPGHPDLVELLISLSGIYRDLHRFAEAQWRHRQAWRVFESAPEQSDYLKLALLNNEAEILRFQGDDANAERFYREALLLSSRVLHESSPRRATFANQLAQLLLEQQKWYEAEPLLLDALEVRRRTLGSGHLELAYTYLQLGALYEASDRQQMAIECLEAAVSIRERHLGANHPDVASALLTLAEVVDSRVRKRELLERAIAILRETPAEPRTLARALSLRSRLPGSDSMRDLTESLDIIERLRPEAGGGELARSRFLSRYLEDYNRMVVLALERGEVSRAFEYSERRRARSLLDQMESAHVDLRGAMESVDRTRLGERENALRSRIAEGRERLRVLRARGGERVTIERTERELDTALDEFTLLYEEAKNASRLWRGHSALPDGRTLTLEDFQRLIVRPNSMAVVFVVGDSDSYVMTIPPVGKPPTFRRLELAEADAATLGVAPGNLTAARLSAVLAPSAETLNSALPEGIIADLASPPTLPSRNRRLSGQLYALFRTLFPPAVWSRLHPLEEVVVIPDGILFRLPFEALVVERPGRSAQTIQYWLDEGPAVRYTSSATLLANLENRPPVSAPGGVLAVSISNPIYPEAWHLRPLPATVGETDAIRRSFGESRVRVLQGAEATEPAVRRTLSDTPFVHFATHGLIDPSDRTLFASMALTPPTDIHSTADDGRLELFEIYELKLNAELAVLSACSTRGGSLIAGEGVFALSRGFLGAGARRVVASLWQVEDKSSAELIKALFVQIHGEHNAPPAGYPRILASAKRSLREQEKWAAPFFWAPFVLDGAR